MAFYLKCKMCGGDIEIQEGAAVGKCKYCGSLMTLPKIDSDKKAGLFNNANEYRQNNEFDKAYDAYKAITEEEPEDPFPCACIFFLYRRGEYGADAWCLEQQKYRVDPAAGLTGLGA